MRINEFIDKIDKYGIDLQEIRKRFLGNDALYMACFLEFLREPNFSVLEKSIQEKNYKHAFDAAHTLKGISGNLGFSVLYNELCVIVESLRAKKYDNIEQEFEAVHTEYSQIIRTFSET